MTMKLSNTEVQQGYQIITFKTRAISENFLSLTLRNSELY
jgi:hypothetical protein